MSEFDNGVTIGIIPPTIDEAALREKMEKRHGCDHDTLIVFVPPGTARDARNRIWRALNTAPTESAEAFEQMQAVAHDDNIRRMFIGP